MRGSRGRSGRRGRRTLVLLGAVWLAACGGTPGTPAPSPAPTPAPPSPHPCDAAVADQPVWGAPGGLKAPVEGHPRGRVLEALWTHRAARARGWLRPIAPPARSEDVGEVAVLFDEGDLVLPANPFDLAGRGLRFQPNASGGYDVAAVAAAFHEPLGARLTLADDDGVEQAIGFGARFFGRAYEAVFVNSDGNLTFGEVDRASTARDLGRVLAGPPRIAPFFADLDPSAGGAVFVQRDAQGFTVTFCKVPGYDAPETATFQVTLSPDGAVEVRYGPAIGLTEAVVALSPGRTELFAPVDLSAPGPTGGGSAAVGERFAARTELDTVALAQKFYAAHEDRYDQLVVWTDQSYARSFAYELTVANEVSGIGLDLYDYAREFGSAGRLRSLVMMDALRKYPDDPSRKFRGENTALSILGQEVGHRWLVFFRFLDHERRESTALLGRDQAHWSFFVDSDASVMEGNDIEDLGGGSFRTVAAVERYSLVDQYAMGLVGEHEVPPFFYVEHPVNVQPESQATSAPRVGVTFSGTRRDVLIQDIVAVHGPRRPPAADSPRVHRQAFVYLVTAGLALDVTQVLKVDRIRLAWEPFFLKATDGRMRAETRLRPPLAAGERVGTFPPPAGNEARGAPDGGPGQRMTGRARMGGGSGVAR